MPPFGQDRRTDSSPRVGMMSTSALGQRQVRRSGYGAMQLAGPFAFGTPPDRASAVGVLQAAVAAGVDHIDTAQYYGPGVVNELIREALYPYPDGLAIVSKVAVRRDGSGAVLPSGHPDQLACARRTTSDPGFVTSDQWKTTPHGLRSADDERRRRHDQVRHCRGRGGAA